MARRVEIPVGRRQATAASPFVSSQSLLNGFVERDPEPGVPDAIYGGPGLVEFAECGTGPIRGLYTFNDVPIAVSGSELYAIAESGAATLLGGIPGAAPVIISDNGTHACIVSDVTSFLYNGTAVAQISDPDFPTASSVDFLDQYLLFTEADTGRYFLSALANAAAYDALDVATAESKPDKLLRVFVDAGEALLFGTRSVEGRYNAGSADFPLKKTQTSLSYGLAGRDAVCAFDNTVGWMAHDFTFRTLRSVSPIAIADPAITSMVQKWTNPGSARAFSFSARGHEWAVWRHEEGCVVYDATTQLWSIRKSYGLPTWRAACSTRAYGHAILGDAVTGKLWRVDPDAHSEGSDPLVRTMVSRTLGVGGAPFTLESVEVEVEVGVGLPTGQGSAPEIWMELSRDGGRTFGTRLTRSLGAAGNRNLRVVWNGPYGDFPPHGGVISFSCSDPVRLVVTKAWADITVNR